MESNLKFGLMPMRVIEEEIIRERLAYHDGNRTHTAKSLKIGLRTLQRKLKKYGLDSAPYSARGQINNNKPIPQPGISTSPRDLSDFSVSFDS